MRMYRVAWLILAALVFGTACGGSQGGAQINVQANEFKFEPASYTVNANQPVRVTMRNTGTVLHDWTVQGQDQQVHLEVQANQTGTTQFTPTKPGTYRVVCTQPGHEQAGMVGQLVVQ